jgi:hypothetical protein
VVSTERSMRSSSWPSVALPEDWAAEDMVSIGFDFRSCGVGVGVGGVLI